MRISQLDAAYATSEIDCDEDLLAMCARQDEAALRELYNRYNRPVYGMLLSTLNNQQDAEEALSDVFVKVWRYSGQFKGKSKFSTWLYRIAANTANDYLRSKARRNSQIVSSLEREDGTTLDIAAPSDTDPEKMLIKAAEKKKLMDALAKLSEKDRMVLVLYHFQDMSYEEICKVMGMSSNNLKVRLFRARQRLKTLCVNSVEE